MGVHVVSIDPIRGCLTITHSANLIIRSRFHEVLFFPFQNSHGFPWVGWRLKIFDLDAGLIQLTNPSPIPIE